MTIETNINDVLGIVAPVEEVEEVVEAPEKCFVTQNRGTERIQVEIECAD
ncbi:hypothetical protein QTO30_18950 [Yoonia sp. GPGPB17]